jgi:hypothetical protein
VQPHSFPLVPLCLLPPLLNSAAYYIYHKKGDKKRAAAAPAAVPPEDEAQLDHLPPGSLPAEDCMGVSCWVGQWQPSPAAVASNG